MTITIPRRRGVKKVWPSITIVNPGKGLNNVISDEYISNEEASSLQDIMFVESGCPAKRNGHTALGTGLVANPKGLASYYSGSNRYLVTVDGTSLKYLNGTAWTAIGGAAFTAGKNTTFVQAKGDLYIWNTTESGRKLSGLTLTAPTTTPSAAAGIFFNGRQIVFGTSTNVNRLYISNSAAADDFTVATGGTGLQPDNATDVPGASSFVGTPANTEAQIVDIAKDDGDKITALAKFQEHLIVFKERSIWQFDFDSSAAPVIKQINGSLGCVSHRSIDNMENDVLFLSRNGYYTLGNEPNFFSVIRTNELSARVHPVIETITASNLSNTASIFSGYTFYSSISTGGTTTNNTTLTYDRRYGAWSKWTNTNANAFTEFVDSSNVKHLYYAADDQPQVYEIDSSYSDNGTAIAAQWTSKAINFGNFSLTKQVIAIDFEFRQIVGSVSLDVITDGNTLTSTTSISFASDLTGTFGDESWGDPMWGGSASMAPGSAGSSSNNIPYRLVVGKDTRTLKFKVYNSNNNENFVFLGMTIYFRPYQMQKFPSNLKLQGSSTVSLPSGGGVATPASTTHKRVVAMTDAATIIPNVDIGDVFTVTLGGNRTMGTPTGTPVDGQQIEIRLRQDSTGSRTVTWAAGYRFSTDLPVPTLTTTPNKSDYIGFQYNATDGVWDCLAVNKGF